MKLRLRPIGTEPRPTGEPRTEAASEHFARNYKICNIKIKYQCKILIVPEEGWFGQPKYSTPTKKSFYVVSTSASIFFILPGQWPLPN